MTQTFIELAIEGGWFPVAVGFNASRSHYSLDDYHTWVFETDDVERARMDRAEVLLDPLAWAAVGKVKGWEKEPVSEYCKACREQSFSGGWQYEWHHFIDILASGETIEEALKRILK